MFIVKCYYRSYKSLSHAHQLQYLYKTALCVMSLCFQPKLFQILPLCLEYYNLVSIFKSYFNSYKSLTPFACTSHIYSMIITKIMMSVRYKHFSPHVQRITFSYEIYFYCPTLQKCR